MRRGCTWRRWAQIGIPALVLLSSCALAPGVSSTPLARMPLASIDVDGRQFTVRLAETPEARAQGFQHVAEREMDREAIYFRFEFPLRPTFHMRNVAAPLLIAWISPGGVVVDVDLMQPGAESYRPGTAVAAALEFTPQHPLAAQVRPGTRVVLDHM